MADDFDINYNDEIHIHSEFLEVQKSRRQGEQDSVHQNRW